MPVINRQGRCFLIKYFYLTLAQAVRVNTPGIMSLHNRYIPIIRIRVMFLYLSLSLTILTTESLISQSSAEGGFIKTRILFVFDASQSMSGYWESDQKINIARKFLISVVDSLETLPDVQMALRVYGHQSPVVMKDCQDTKLEVGFDVNNAHKIRQKLRFLNPNGNTPIAYSLDQASNDFPPCGDCRNIIIMITDGIEECGGDPCAVSRKLQEQGITLKPFIIGIGIDPDFKKTFDCVGFYFNAAKEENFKEVLRVVITQALNTTSAQVNLLDEDDLPTETNVNMTFYDLFSGKVKHNFVHTMNHKGNPDTLFLDPLISYWLEIHTIPPIVIDTVRVTAGKHTIIAADAPQGYLEARTIGRTHYRDMQFIVREHGEMKTLHHQKMNEQEKYLIGRYDLEFPTLPKILLNDVEIKQSHTTSIEIPRPGIITFISTTDGFGSIYSEEGNVLIWIANLDSNKANQSLAIQPGVYTVVFRPGNSKNTFSTVTKKFEVKAGGSSAIELY
ncbi:VWA domain-containing protein [Bacteroidota bacterium]